MIRGVALTAGRDQPSARFRVRQHLDRLRRLGIDLVERPSRINAYRDAHRSWARAPLLAAKVGVRVPDLVAAHRADLTIVSKVLLPGRVTLESVLSRPLVYDIDDAVWLRRPNGPGAVEALCRRASLVVAGNDYLASHCACWSENVTVIPTAIDTQRFTPRSPSAPRDGRRFVIGWTGTAANLGYLRAIEKALAEVIGSRDAVLLVVCDERPSLPSIPSNRVVWERWSPGVEATAIQRMDVGLMPLPDDEWTRAKCAFKLLQYMACAIPFVASPVGVNAALVERGCGLGAAGNAGWVEALDALADDRSMGAELGSRGRELATSDYSVDVIAPRLATALQAAVA